MKRIYLFAVLVSLFGFAWQQLDVLQLKMVGQPSMSGPIQSHLEKPFFTALGEKTGLRIQVDYRELDKVGFKDDHQLAMMKEGYFDLVSLRFLQNSREEPSIIGLDLPGLNSGFQNAQIIAEAYSPVVDKNLQERFGIKLLGIWGFGPQVILCTRPVASLADLAGLKVRVGSESLFPLISAQGAVPIVIPFDQVFDALAAGLVDCAVGSRISAYAAGWFNYITHVYPIAVHMGLNGIAIRLEIWNKLSPEQRDIFAKAINGYIDNVWSYAQAARDRANICLHGKLNCELDQKFRAVVFPVKNDDVVRLRRFALTTGFEAWAKECNRVVPDCSSSWTKAVKPVLPLLNTH